MLGSAVLTYEPAVICRFICLQNPSKLLENQLCWVLLKVKTLQFANCNCNLKKE